VANKARLVLLVLLVFQDKRALARLVPKAKPVLQAKQASQAKRA
jgi:hypothetical protein